MSRKIKSIFVANIAKYIGSKSKTQLAKEAGMPQKTFYNATTNNDISPSLSTIEDVCNSLGANPWLMLLSESSKMIDENSCTVELIETIIQLDEDMRVKLLSFANHYKTEKMQVDQLAITK